MEAEKALQQLHYAKEDFDPERLQEYSGEDMSLEEVYHSFMKEQMEETEEDHDEHHL